MELVDNMSAVFSSSIMYMVYRSLSLNVSQETRFCHLQTTSPSPNIRIHLKVTTIITQ